MTRSNMKVSFVIALVAAFAAGDLTVAPSLELPAAHAAKKKKKKGADDKKSEEEEKKGDEKKDAKVEEKAKPKEEEKLRTTGPAQIKAPVAGDSKIDLSSKADKKRDEAIAEIQKVLPKVSGEQKGELVFRLAELYWAKSRYLYNSEFKEFDEAYTKWVDGGREGKEPALTGYTKKSDAYKKQALQNYGVVLEQYPDYPRLDEILYIMAYNEYEAGKKKEAVDNYSKLIRQYPKSEYVSDAYLALGEHYFGSNDLPKATKAYQKAYDKGLEDKRPGVYNYALYKLAWCDYNAQGYKDALDKFKKVVTASEKGDQKDKGVIQLKNEALNDMVLTFAQLDETKDAYDYFKSKAGAEKAYNLTNKMSAVYKEQGKNALQIDTLRLIINLNPDDANCPDYQSQIVQAYEKMGDRASVRKEVTRLVELYRPGASWYRKNEANKQNIERARTVAETRLRELVTDYHRFAQKNKKVDDYLVARDIYAQYLQAFPDSDTAYRLNFYYAELLWDIGEWRKAAGEYDNVVKRDPKGEYTRICAYNAVLAWEKIVKGERPPELKDGGSLGCVEGDKACEKKMKKNDGKIGGDVKEIVKLKKGGTYAEEPIPADEVALANACDAYVNVVPLSDKDAALQQELIKVKFKAAYIFHSHNHFDEGAKRFGELIARWPDSEQARTAADVTLDSYAAREQWQNLEKWSRTFAENKKMMGDAKFAASVMKFMEGATFKSVMITLDESKKAKDPVEGTMIAAGAASRFEAFVEEFPKSEYAPTALFNATLIYAGADQVDLAIRAANKLLGGYGKEIAAGDNLKNKLEEQTVLNLAAYYEKIAEYPKAAESYTKFVDKYKDNPKSPDALYNAGIFYLGLGDTKNATASFARYIKDFSKQKDVPDVYLRMAAIYEDQADAEGYKRAAAMYGDFEKLHGKDAKPEQLLAARYKSAVMLQKSGRTKEMLEVCNGIVAGWKKIDEKVRKTPEGQLAGGYCGYQVLEDEWLAYTKIKVEARGGGNPKKVLAAIGETLDTKKKKRDEIAKKYVDVLAYGNGEWGVAGLYRASEALFDYVKTLRETPDPPMFRDNPEALDIFRTELENIAFPVEDEGIQALEKALEKAFELGIYSDYTIAIEDRLKKFKPARFGRIYEMPFFPNAAVSTSQKTAQR